MEREIIFCYFLDIQIMKEGDVKLKLQVQELGATKKILLPLELFYIGLLGSSIIQST